jgi:hypothetical protein
VSFAFGPREILSCQGAARFDSEITALEMLENKGNFLWLGVRDGIRNWLVTAA